MFFPIKQWGPGSLPLRSAFKAKDSTIAISSAVAPILRNRSRIIVFTIFQICLFLDIISPKNITYPTKLQTYICTFLNLLLEVI